MKFNKTITDNRITSVNIDSGGIEITEAEYNEILDLIRNKPIAPDGYDYRLKADLTWELVELPPIPEDDELTAVEALEIITGGAT